MMRANLSKLKAHPRKQDRRGLSEEEGRESIKALRRGVAPEAIAQALKITRAGFYFALGVWARRYAK